MLPTISYASGLRMMVSGFGRNCQRLNRERKVAMNRSEKIAQKITADYTSVDWSFDIFSFFQPADGGKMDQEQVKMSKLILLKVLDWSGGDMMQMIRRNIKGNPGLMREVEDAGLKMLR
jgi:hypothetical protein